MHDCRGVNRGDYVEKPEDDVPEDDIHGAGMTFTSS
jgi:hypothetical protein